MYESILTSLISLQKENKTIKYHFSHTRPANLKGQQTELIKLRKYICSPINNGNIKQFPY